MYCVNSTVNSHFITEFCILVQFIRFSYIVSVFGASSAKSLGLISRVITLTAIDQKNCSTSINSDT